MWIKNDISRFFTVCGLVEQNILPAMGLRQGKDTEI
jgi:hypothetical protein